MKLGVVSLVLGACALLLALAHFWLGPLSPPPNLEQTVATKAASVRDAALAGLRGQAPPPAARSSPRWSADQLAGAATGLMGGLALVLGLAAWSKGGRQRRAGVGGAVLGAATLAFQVLAAALVVLSLKLAAGVLGLILLAIIVSLLLGLLGG